MEQLNKTLTRHFEHATYLQSPTQGISIPARAVNLTVLTAFSATASEQSKATGKTMKDVGQLLDYLATHPDVTMQFSASNMILNILLDAS